jgi:Relaxase/Mobilisation nuclease domain
MVAKVNTGQNISGLLNYNENKVKAGVAKCIHENQFGCNVDRLNFYDKLKTFQGYINRNHRATTKAVHISLNFDPSEKPGKDLLKAIATKYMDKIGFGNQPYLVYQHLDAAHPHIHIVTTNIQRDGKRIILYNIGKNQSEKARKELEKEYGLVRAEGKKTSQTQTVSAIDVKQAVYGKLETKRTISNTVRFVVKNYRYTSIPELNAVLRQYNVMADLGKEGSQMKIKKGLLYRLIDERGKKVGMAIKSSMIYGKPTLAFQEKQFKLNEILRRPHKERLVNCIEKAFGTKHTISKANFVPSLGQEGICVLFRQNEEGRIYGITFVDNKTKVVFNGSDLGKAYGAKAITDRLTSLSKPDSFSIQPTLIQTQQEKSSERDSAMEEAIKDLTTAKQFDYSSPDVAMKRRKRKKRRGRSI